MAKWDMHQIIGQGDEWPTVVVVHRGRGSMKTYAPITCAVPHITSDGIIGHCDCGACGRTIDAWDGYCRHCGAKVEHEHKQPTGQR